MIMVVIRPQCMKPQTSAVPLPLLLCPACLAPGAGCPLNGRPLPSSDPLHTYRSKHATSSCHLQIATTCSVQVSRPHTSASLDSSVGRALDWRSKGPRYDPGSGQPTFFSLSKCSVFYVIIYKELVCHVLSWLPRINSPLRVIKRRIQTAICSETFSNVAFYINFW